MANILLIRDSEILPLTGKEKKLRMAMLADWLVARGHNVTWFCSTFNHMCKEYYFEHDTEYVINERYKIVLKNAGCYKKNLSYTRIKHHQKLAKVLKKFLEENKGKFDAVVVSHPIIELAKVTVDFCNQAGLPVIVDVRDKWPQTFTDYMPKLLKPFVKLATMRMAAKTKSSFFHANEIVSMSRYMLDWSLRYSGIHHSLGNVFYLGTSLSDTYLDLTLPVSDPNKLVCTFVGGLINAYDLKHVLQASQLTGRELSLNIVGDGPCYGSLIKAAKGTDINLPGWSNEEGVAMFLLSADILLFPLSPSLSQDVLPNKFFDYLWAAKPILASCKGEMADLIRDERLGYVYKFGDKEDFMKGIQYLSDPSVREEISSNMKKIYKERFSADKIYGKYADLVESLL